MPKVPLWAHDAAAGFLVFFGILAFLAALTALPIGFTAADYRTMLPIYTVFAAAFGLVLFLLFHFFYPAEEGYDLG